MAITKFIKDLFVVDIEEEVPAPQKKKPQTSSKVTNLNQTKVIDNRPKAAQKKQTVSKVITPKSKVQKQQVQKQQVEQKKTRIDSKENRTMPINNQSTKVCLFEPRVFAETQDIADELKSNRAALVNLTKIDGTPKKRIVDFLSGTVYALEGDIQKVGTDIFLCTPNDFGVEGEISDKEEYFDET